MIELTKRKVKYLFDDVFKGITPIYSEEPNDFIIFGQRNNSKNGMSYNDCKYAEPNFYNNRSEKEFLKYGDILINSLGGGTCGRVGFFNILDQKILTDGIPYILRNKQYNKYFYYVLLSNQKYLEDLALGATNQVSLKDFDLINYNLKYIDDNRIQNEIVYYLDKKCTTIHQIMLDVQNEIDNLEEYKKSIISEAVTRGVNPNAKFIDSGIKWIPIINSKWDLKKAKYCFKCRNTKGNNLNLELLSPTQKFGVIPQKKYEELTSMVTVKINEDTDLKSFKTIHKGDYCISLRSFEGGFEYSEYEGVVSPAYTVFYPTINIDRRYYKYLFKIKTFVFEVNSYSLSLRDGKPISFDTFGNTYIPVPSIEEQHNIADYLDKKCSDIDSIITDKKSQLETLEEYKKSLIYEYVTGKKEVPNEL